MISFITFIIAIIPSINAVENPFNDLFDDYYDNNIYLQCLEYQDSQICNSVFGCTWSHNMCLYSD